MTGTEGPQIPPTTEHPQNWSHQDILTAFEQIATEPANGAATKYRESGVLWTQAVERFRQRMEVTIASAWEGNSATASINAIRRYTADADKLTPAFTAMSTQVTAAAASAVNTKSWLPGEFDPGFLDSMPWNKAVVRGKREEAESEAREVMDNKYVTPFAGTDTAIPVLPRPANPTQEQADSGAGPLGSRADGGGQPTNPGSTTQPQQQLTEPDGTLETPAEDTESEDPTATTPSSENGDEVASDDTDQVTDSPSTSPAATSPSATNPSAAIPAAPSPGAGGLPGGGANLGGGSPSTGTPIAGTPIPGSSPSSPLAATSSAGGTTGSARGTSGMPGMMGGGAGAGRGKDDQSEHSIPEYLITAANSEELIGDRGFVIEGGVLGSQYPSANPPRESASDV
ncbi:hypothetical protein [Nocardia lasii]|uniref:PPE domain-containing protein n=1 Tax=Nocardia lasii TaxID=1616107 RepID=A0ABW1JWA0_9NOCA